jgi:GntR family transcriptional regulator/MocR family aminotransferase
MAKRASSFELALDHRPQQMTIARWLYDQLRRAILDQRLRPGTRLPATRDFARQYGVSRGTVVTVFERLQDEGYFCGRPGAGTRVTELPSKNLPRNARPRVQIKELPEAVRGLPSSQPPLPFRPYEPALAEFPTEIWARLAGSRMRRASTSLLAACDVRGYQPLRVAISAYLGSSRGVNCSPDQIVIVSGIQQALDLLARLFIRPGETVWMEDPGYFGALAAFRNAGARIVPVPVDECGIEVSTGQKLCNRAKLAYVTPAHQFPLCVTMTLERRLALLAWARRTGALIIEDDYDSEYRFAGQPVPALQGLDKRGSVIFLGSFNKILFPSLRLGYAVLPPALLVPLLNLRRGADFYPSIVNQAILSDFVIEGHLARHIRRMRGIYANRLGALQDAAQVYLKGLLEISPIQAGLNTAGFLRNGMTSRHAETVAADGGVEVLGFHRFTVGKKNLNGLLVGFAAFSEREIKRGAIALATALERRSVAAPRLDAD